MSDLKPNWNRVTTLLKTAVNQLSAEEGAVSLFREFLDHNELELAWDELAALGTPTETQIFWRSMADAAREMRLIEKEAVASRHLKNRFDIQPV